MKMIKPIMCIGVLLAGVVFGAVIKPSVVNFVEPTWKSSEKGAEKVNINARYSFKPDRIRTPFTVKLSEQAYLSVHEATVVLSDEAWLKQEGNSLTVLSNMKTAGGSVTPWRTIQIADKPGGLIESSLILNLNEPCEIKDTSWINPGVTLWDWRAHGAIADDGFVYGLNTESYIRFIDCAADIGNFEAKLFLLYPKKNGWAVIGRADKYLPAAAVKIKSVSSKNITFTLKESGPLMVWNEKGAPQMEGATFKSVGDHLYLANLPVTTGAKEVTLTR